MQTGSFTEFESKEENLHYEGVNDIDPIELNKKIKSNPKSIQLIDVRLPEEFTGELGHIPGSQLIVLDTIPDQMDKLALDKTIVFVCRSGSRSARATAFAQTQGYKSVYNLKGGMLLWNELQFETES